MKNIIDKRNWWVLLVAAGVISVGVTQIQQKWLPDSEFASFLLVFALLGIAFYWVYSIDKKSLWWAQIPTLAIMSLLVTGIVAFITPKDASGSSPYGVITLGVCSVIMGLVLKRPRVKIVMFFIAIITLLVGILMLPVDFLWKIIFIVAEVLLIGFLVWQINRQFPEK